MVRSTAAVDCIQVLTAMVKTMTQERIQESAVASGYSTLVARPCRGSSLVVNGSTHTCTLFAVIACLVQAAFLIK